MRAAKNAAARERKERMMNMESERKKNAPQTQSEIVKIQKNNSTLNKARRSPFFLGPPAIARARSRCAERSHHANSPRRAREKNTRRAVVV